MFRTVFLMVLSLLLLALGAYAADGDKVDDDLREGRDNPMFVICDSKVAADAGGTCAEFLHRLAADTYIFSVDKAAGCSDFSIIISDRALEGGDLHDVITLTTLGDTEVRVYGPLTERIVVTLSTLTGCTDFDLTLELIYDED